MKKMLPIFLFLTLPFLLFSKTKNTLASFAGTMELTPQNVCDGDIAYAIHNADQNLDAGDVLKFVLHDNAGTSLGNIFGGQGDLTSAYTLLSGMTTGTTYYISAIAGMDDGNGDVDLTDPELSVAAGTPTIFLPFLVTSFQETICEGDFYNFHNIICHTPGPYQIVLISVDGCDSIVTLDLDVLNPQAGIFPPSEINCDPMTGTLQAVVVDLSPSVSYIWSGPCILSGNGSSIIQVGCGGDYSLTVSKTQQGTVCFSDPFTVTVIENNTVPIADAGPDQVIDCTNPSVVLGGPNTSTGPNLVYNWTSPNGTSGIAPTLTVTSPGEYCLLVVNTNNFCQSSTECVTVTASGDIPIVTATSIGNLTCVETEIDIFTQTANCNNCVFAWSNGSTNQTITTNSPGTYTVTVTNDIGCSNTASADVDVDADVPVATIASQGVLTCANICVTIDGNGSSVGANMSYQWILDGSLLFNVGQVIDACSPGVYTLIVTNNQNGCSSEATTIVTVDSQEPDANAGPDQIIDCSNSEVILDGSGSGMGANLSYIWSYSGVVISTTVSTPVSSAGEYCLIVTDDNNGCTNTDCVIVTVDVDVPTVTIDGDVLDCINDSADLNAQTTNCNNCTYLWSNNIQGQTQSVNTPGTYTVTVTNNNGCTAVDDVTVTENILPPNALIATPWVLDCVSTSVTLDGSASSTGSDFSYQWFSGNGVSILNGTTLLLNVSQAGTYELMVTNNNNGCTTTSSVVVSENTNSPIANAGLDQVLDCATTEVFLDGNASTSGNSITYEWYDASGAAISTSTTLTVIISGTYTLVVTDVINGCTEIDEVIVTGDGPLNVDLGNDKIFDCTVPEVIIQGNTVPTGTGYTYQWTTTDGIIVSGADTPTPAVTSAGTYFLEINDIPNGCVGVDEITLISLDDVYQVNPNMNLNCDLNVPNVLDANLMLTGFDLSYQWMTPNGQFISGENTLTPTVGSIGNYTLTVTENTTGCTSTTEMIMDDFILPTPVIDAPGGTIISCLNSGVVLNAGNSNVNQPALYSWIDPNGNQIGNDISITVNAGGIYELIITDPNGCENQTTITTSEDIDPPNFTLPTALVLDCANNFTQEIGPILSGINPNEVTYKWLVSNNLISIDSSILITSQMGGQYEVIMTNVVNGCETTGNMQVTVNGFDFGISTTAAGCDLQDGTATATTGLANSLIEWSNGEQGNTVTNLAEGWYSVTLTDTDNDCSQHDNFYIDEDISCKVVIAGYVLEDPSNTCTYDASMAGVGCVMVKLEPFGFYTLTDSTGYYEFIVDDGSYTVEYIGSQEVDLICPTPGSYDVVLDVNGTVSDGNHFFVQRPGFDLCISKNIGNARPGFKQFNCVQICNFGEEPEDAIVTFVHDSIFAEVTPLPNIIPLNGNAAGYSYDEATYTFTWNLQNLAPGDCRKIMWRMEVPVTTPVGYVISTEAKVNPIIGDTNPTNNCLAWDLAVTGSYDPNDKRNFVGETQWGGAIYEDDMTMEYAIRFQNVGNDTAFTVVVRDTLDDAHLDVTSIRGFIASHDMQVEFEENNILIFRFENINLVDSFTNEPGSNGWLSFEIDRLQGQDFGTEIKNQAAIYFDFNAPVITNEVVNTLTEDPVSIFYPKENKIDVRVIPTITDGNVLLQYVLEKPGSLSIQIHNAKGQRMQEFDFGKKQTGEHAETLNLKNYPAGVYFVFVKTENGSAVARVVKQ